MAGVLFEHGDDAPASAQTVDEECAMDLSDNDINIGGYEPLAPQFKEPDSPEPSGAKKDPYYISLPTARSTPNIRGIESTIAGKRSRTRSDALQNKCY